LRHTPVVSLNYDAGETVGWQAFVREIGTFYESLPAAARSSTTVLASNYGEAGAVGHLDPPQQSSWRQQRRARRTSVGVLAASRILDHDMAAPSRLRLTQLSASVLDLFELVDHAPDTTAGELWHVLRAAWPSGD
jgi:hypothetical protein